MPVDLDLVTDETSDDELVVRCRAGEEIAVRVLTRRHNQRLFRLARAIVRNDSDAEDVVQETYVRAFTNLDRFRGDANIVTWLTRIAINDALGRLKRRRPSVDVEAVSLPSTSPQSNPETVMEQRHLRVLLERSIDDLPDPLRIVFVARLVEGLSIEETADLFGLRPETVKTRLHRSRRRLQASLEEQVGGTLHDAFSFDGERCERTADAVVRRLGLSARNLFASPQSN